MVVLVILFFVTRCHDNNEFRKALSAKIEHAAPTCVLNGGISLASKGVQLLVVFLSIDVDCDHSVIYARLQSRIAIYGATAVMRSDGVCMYIYSLIAVGVGGMAVGKAPSTVCGLWLVPSKYWYSFLYMK